MGALRKIDRRFFMLMLLILFIIPAVRPLGIPIPVSKYTKEVYDYINSLPPGSLVVVATDVDVALWPEERAFTKAVLWHLLQRPIKFVIVNFGPDSPVLINTVLEELNIEKTFPNKKYGEDYVLLGYLAGGETAYAAFCTDVHAVYETDYFGTPIEELPIMKELKDSSDIDLLIHITGADADAPVRQFVSTFHIPYAAAPTIGWVPTYMPYYDAGLLIGLIQGVRGGAEYELLVKRPGVGLATTDCLTLGFLYVIILMILGNIDYFATRKKGG